MKILGVLPLAGSGVRLGADFHKALMPFPTQDKLSFQAIVRFSIQRLEMVSDEIVAVVSPDSQHSFPVEKFNLTALIKSAQGEAPSSIQLAAGYALDHGFSHIAVSLPDTFWEPLDGFSLLVEHIQQNKELGVDGALGLFNGDPTMLDGVSMSEDNIVKAISTRGNLGEPNQKSIGWGCFVLATSKAITFDDSMSWAENLMQARLTGLQLSSTYIDIGSPQRYLSGLKELLD